MRKIWPSVIEMTLVGMYAETSPAWVSMIGSAVSEPPGFLIRGSSLIASVSSEILAARSSRRLWR